MCIVVTLRRRIEENRGKRTEAAADATENLNFSRSSIRLAGVPAAVERYMRSLRRQTGGIGANCQPPTSRTSRANSDIDPRAFHLYGMSTCFYCFIAHRYLESWYNDGDLSFQWPLCSVIGKNSFIIIEFDRSLTNHRM